MGFFLLFIFEFGSFGIWLKRCLIIKLEFCVFTLAKQRRLGLIWRKQNTSAWWCVT